MMRRLCAFVAAGLLLGGCYRYGPPEGINTTVAVIGDEQVAVTADNLVEFYDDHITSMMSERGGTFRDLYETSARYQKIRPGMPQVLIVWGGIADATDAADVDYLGRFPVGVPCVFLVTVSAAAGPLAGQVNGRMHELQTTSLYGATPNVTVLDWSAAVATNPSLSDDGVLPNEAGQDYMRALILDHADGDAPCPNLPERNVG